MKQASHRGWSLSCSKLRPVTGIWVAERRGVTMCAGTEEAIKRMVDTRVCEWPPTGDYPPKMPA